MPNADEIAWFTYARIGCGRWGESMAYEYDFFISFSRDCSAGEWVVNHFEPVLQQSLDELAGRKISIYCYTNQPNAMTWPSEVMAALRKTRFLVSILTPPYFYSSVWCVAEWTTMLERQRLTGFGTEDNPASLIYPVIYSDGEHFPQAAKDIRWNVDFRDCAIPDKQFRDMAGYVDFRLKVRRLAAELLKMLNSEPDWDPSWPVHDPRATPPAVPKPKFPHL